MQDFTISIAVLHHLSTNERRLQGMRELLRITRPGGRVLVFVWAMEQHGKRKFEKDKQDVLVPWKMPKKYVSTDTDQHEITLERYYHLFRREELEQLALDTQQCRIVEIGYDRDNWFAILERT
jgi:SAM-dependent methyltransferase